MFTGLQGQKIIYTTLLWEKYAKKNPGFDKSKTAGVFGLILHDLVMGGISRAGSRHLLSTFPGLIKSFNTPCKNNDHFYLPHL